MSIFSRRKSPEELEEELDRAELESHVVTKRAEIEERKAVISQLKKEYGGGWQKMLGVSKLTDLSTLKSFLHGAKKGMAKQSGHIGVSRDLMVIKGKSPSVLPQVGQGGAGKLRVL
jgi:hypothetical protein